MKRTFLLIGALVVLLLLYFFSKSSEHVVSADRPFIQCDSTKVTALKIEGKDGVTNLTKRGEDWVVVGSIEYPANKKTVGDALSKLSTMKMLSMITEKSDRYSEFEVDDATATKVTVTSTGKPVTFLLGKAGQSAQTNFARLLGGKEVWEIGGNYSGTFKKKPNDWRDKTITDFPMADIKKVTLQYPTQTVTLTLVDTTWNVESGKIKFDVEKSMAERLTRMLAKTSTVDFADTLAPNSFDNPELHLTAELATGDPLDLRFIPKDAEGSQYYVRKAGAKSDFVIYKSTFTAMAKKADDFKNKPNEPAGKPPKKAKP